MSDPVRVKKPVRSVEVVPMASSRMVFPANRRNAFRSGEGTQTDVRNQVGPDPETERLRDIERKIEEAFCSGREEGKQEVEAALRSDHDKKWEIEQRRFATLMQNTGQQFSRFHRDAERLVIRFALAVAEQIVKREVARDNDVVMHQIRESFRRVAGVERIKLRVNPADEQWVRENRASFLAGSDTIREMVIEADDKVDQGGCILESDLGNIDARLSSQMKKIEEVLLNYEAAGASGS